MLLKLAGFKLVSIKLTFMNSWYQIVTIYYLQIIVLFHMVTTDKDWLFFFFSYFFSLRVIFSDLA